MRLWFFQEKTYSQQEVDKIKQEYEAKLKRAYEMVDNFLIQIQEKNKEIKKLEFYVETMAKAMRVVGDFMREMRR